MKFVNRFAIYWLIGMVGIMNIEASPSQSPGEIKTEVLRILNSSVPSESKVESLVKIGKPAVPTLLTQLGTSNHVVILALGQIADDRAVDALLKELARVNLSDSNVNVRGILIIDALRQIGQAQAEQDVLRIFNQQNLPLDVRLRAAAALARFGSPTVREQVTNFALDLEKNPDKMDRQAASEDLSLLWFEIGTHEAADILLQRLLGALTHESVQIAEYIVQLGYTDIIERLFEKLYDRSSEEPLDSPVKMAIIRSLVKDSKQMIEPARLLNALDYLRGNVHPMYEQELQELKRILQLKMTKEH